MLNSSPTLLAVMIEEVHTIFASDFLDPVYSFATEGAENFG